MPNRSKKYIFYLLFLAISTFGVVLLGALLRSGYNYIGDGEIFVFRDNLLGFLTILAICYLLGLLWCNLSLRVPRYDYVGRIIGANLIIYGALGLSLSWLRIPLYSRTLILSEFILSTILILTFVYLNNRFFPLVIGAFSSKPQEMIGMARYLRWVILESRTTHSFEIDAVALDTLQETNSEQTRSVAALSQQGVTVYDRNHLEMLLTARIRLDALSLSEFDSLSTRTTYAFLKRLLDILFTLLLTPAFIVITAFAAALIKLDSPGPVFLSQKHVGFKGNHFTLYKFRSMYHNDISNSPRFAEENDERITRVGRFLRRTRLDEIPQFWNVLKGDMSIIGPRPEQLEFVTRFARDIPYYGFRHTVHPGITGWAQTMHGYAADEGQTRRKLEYDFFYIKNISPWLDLVIFCRTFKVLIAGTGVR